MACPIGIFDSGMGGITVLHEARRRLPQEDFLYFADTRNVPYGNKTKEEVLAHVRQAVDFLIGRRVKAMVMACNTATSVAVRRIRADFPHLPVLGMEPAVKPALAATGPHQRILVMATPLTLQEEKFAALLHHHNADDVVDRLPLPQLVDFVEQEIFDAKRVQEYIRQELYANGFAPGRYATVVLGCTHFPFFRPWIARLFSPGVEVIDGNDGTARHLGHTLRERGLCETGAGRVEFHSSGDEAADRLRFERLRRHYADLAR